MLHALRAATKSASQLCGFAPEDIRDPYGMAFWPLFQGRNGCRTPMPWSDTDATSGFSGGKPWLPIPAEHRDNAVDKQLKEIRFCMPDVPSFAGAVASRY
jgi:glycosidase